MRQAPQTSPPKALPGWITPELIAETRAVWQPYYKEDLTDEQAVALLIPVGVLYEILYSGDADHEEEADNGDEEVHCSRPGE